MDVLNLKIGIFFPVFFVFLSVYLTESVNTNFVIYRTCNVIFGYNSSDCEKLGSGDISNSTVELEKLVEPTANIILITVKVCSSIIPAIYCLFLGPWSDKNGRKPILLLSTFGLFISYIIKIIVFKIPNASPWYLMFECIPIIFTGGLSTFTMIGYCYLADASSIENRGMRLTICDCVLIAGISIGNISSSYILKAAGYFGVFLSAAIVQLIAFVLVFFIKETIDTSELQEYSSIFTIKHIKDIFKTTVRQRSNYGRIILFLLIGLIILYLLADAANNSLFLYVRAKFEWSLQKFTIYSGLAAASWIFWTILVVYVMQKRMGIQETNILLMGTIMGFSSSILQAFAETDFQLYTAVLIASWGGQITALSRSLISKEIPANECGKIFSVSEALNTISTLIMGYIYTSIYNSTLTIFPGTFLIVKCLFLFFLPIIVIIVMVLKKTQGGQASVHYETIVDETEDDEAVVDETEDDEAVDDEAVDDEAVDDEAVDKCCQYVNHETKRP